MFFRVKVVEKVGESSRKLEKEGWAPGVEVKVREPLGYPWAPGVKMKAGEKIRERRFEKVRERKYEQI